MASALADGARMSFVDGLAGAFLVSAGALVVCAIIFAVIIPGRQKTDGQPEASSDPEGIRSPAEVTL